MTTLEKNMTENEAQKYFLSVKDDFLMGNRTANRNNAYEIALSWFEEVQAHRAIGTVEQFKALKEKEERFDRNIRMFNSIGLEIRNKAIDEFAERMKELVYKWIDKGVIAVGCIDEIAEEMRGAG